MEQSQVSEQSEQLVQNDPLETREVQEAAGRYAQFSRRIRSLAKTMGGKGLARVMIAANEFPYAALYPKFRSKAEEELFNTILATNAAKAVIATALASSKDEIEQRVVDGMKEELTTETKKEETNG